VKSAACGSLFPDKIPGEADLPAASGWHPLRMKAEKRKEDAVFIHRTGTWPIPASRRGRVSMRNLIFSTNSTLDGFINHEAVIADDELHAVYAELLETADLVLFGRAAFELLASYWPSAESDESLSAGVRRYAKRINKISKIVYSRTLKTVDWNAKIAREFTPQSVLALKRQAGGNILLSSGVNLAGQFLKHGLIDEFRFLLQPIILGNGMRLFEKDAIRRDLKLSGTRILASGVVELIYRKASPD
jgi:dihydrofolate reductase